MGPTRKATLSGRMSFLSSCACPFTQPSSQVSVAQGRDPRPRHCGGWCTGCPAQGQVHYGTAFPPPIPEAALSALARSVPLGNEDIAIFLLRHGAHFCSYILLDSPDPSKHLLRKYFIETSTSSIHAGKMVSDHCPQVAPCTAARFL